MFPQHHTPLWRTAQVKSLVVTSRVGATAGAAGGLVGVSGSAGPLHASEIPSASAAARRCLDIVRDGIEPRHCRATGVDRDALRRPTAPPESFVRELGDARYAKVLARRSPALP